MECNSEKAMQYKNFLATLDESISENKSLFNEKSVELLSYSLNTIIPSIENKLDSLLIITKDVLEKNNQILKENNKLIKTQKLLCNNNTNKIISNSNCGTINSKYFIDKLKNILSAQTNRKITGNDMLYNEAKFRLFEHYNCSKWNDLLKLNPVEVCNTINNIAELFKKRYKD